MPHTQHYKQKQLNQLIGELTMQEVNQCSAAIGRDVLTANMIQMVTTDTCVYSSWDVAYGICHAMVLTAASKAASDYWKELRSHFLYKKNGIEGVMYTTDHPKHPANRMYQQMYQD